MFLYYNIIAFLGYFLMTVGLLSPMHALAAASEQKQIKESAKETPPIPKKLRVVVSITPFHALVAGVMCGVDNPILLVPAGASPHHYSLKPSEIKQLQNADVIFWAGPTLETFLTKPLASLARGKIIRLDQTPKLKLHPLRLDPNWHDESDEHGHAHSHGDDDTTSNDDMHFWLDPNNAKMLVDHITTVLSDADPTHIKKYQENAADIKKRLENLATELKKKLEPIHAKPYLVFHDGYQYFEQFFHLNAVGALTLHPEIPISLERLQNIQTIIKKSQAQCIFSEPQFTPKLVQKLVQDTNIKTGVLDPLGTPTPHCADGYFKLLKNLQQSLDTCLK